MTCQHKPMWTKGPWRYGRAGNYEGFFIAPDCRLPTLAAVQVSGRVEVFNFPGQTEANACLMAAAPDLAEALTKLRNEIGGITDGFEGCLRECLGHTNFAVLIERIEVADAALAKANGQ